MLPNLQKIKKALWFSLGLFCLAIAYIGVVTPGIPWSTPTVCAAFCFAKSNDTWHKWIMNHRLFGPFLRDWSERRVFPRRAKWMMFLTMDISLIVLWFTTGNIWLVLGLGSVMMAVAWWAWQFPESREAADERLAQGKRLGWFV